MSRTQIPMTREVVKFQAPDGQVFDSAQQAQRHAEDLLCQELETFLTLACPGMDRPSTQRAVLALEANQGETAKRLKIILSLLEWVKTMSSRIWIVWYTNFDDQVEFHSAWSSEELARQAVALFHQSDRSSFHVGPYEVDKDGI